MSGAAGERPTFDTDVFRSVRRLAMYRPGAPWLLDAFCGAGGAAMGYWLAGFNVLGVDIKPQKNYPFLFVQGDAVAFIRAFGAAFDVIHASPPCQFASTGSKFKGVAHKHHNFIPDTRAALERAGVAFVIENVPGAAQWLKNPIALWGDLFGLRVVRDRLFECSVKMDQPMLATVSPVPFTGTASRDSYSCFANGASHITVAGNNFNAEDGKTAMDIHWMTSRAEIKESIPPAYTEYIGRQMMRVVMNTRQEARAA